MPSSIERMNPVAKAMSEHPAFIEGGLDAAFQAVKQKPNCVAYCITADTVYAVVNPGSGVNLNHPTAVELGVIPKRCTFTVSAKNGGDFNKQIKNAPELYGNLNKFVSDFLSKIIKGDLVPLNEAHEIMEL